MSTVEEIESAIERLTLSQRAELMAWLHGWDDDDWDRQMKADAAAGKFDRLIAQVREDQRAGRLRDFP
jgi:hypothetical protein